MKNLKSFKEFINENWSGFISEGSSDSSKLLMAMFDAVKRSGNATIKTPLDYQNFDKESYFDVVSNGTEFRVHYNPDSKVILTNMDSNENISVGSVEELLTQLN